MGRARRRRARGGRRAARAARGVLPLGAAVLGGPHHPRHLLRRPEGRGAGSRRDRRTALRQRGRSPERRGRPRRADGDRPPPRRLPPRHPTGPLGGDRPGEQRRGRSHYRAGADPEVPDEGPGLRPPRVGAGHVEGRTRARPRVVRPAAAEPARALAPAHPAGGARHRWDAARASACSSRSAWGLTRPAGFTELLDGAKS